MNKLLLLCLLLATPLYAQDVTEDPVMEVPETDLPVMEDSAAAAPEENAPEVVTEEKAPETMVVPNTTFPAETQPVITAEVPEEEKPFIHRKSHWLSTFGFEAMKYEVPANFTGARKKFSPADQELWGGRIGLGGQLYLGAGFFTTTKLETYYLGTLFTRRYNAGPQDISVDAAYIRRNGNIWGGEVLQQLGWMWDMKAKNPFLDEWTYLTIEPFIEAGVGFAHAYNRISYHYDTGPSPGVREDYRLRVADDLVNTKFGAGVNFTANTGFFLYLRATVNNFDITNRKTRTFTAPDQTAGSTVVQNIKDAKIDPVTVYALGGGYKF